VIGRVYRGGDSGGLLRYLYGPGRYDDHSDQHLVASWDGDPAGLEPPLGRRGRYRPGRLADLLDSPLDLLEREAGRFVWHCALRAAPGDRRLSDGEWQELAEDVMDRTGIAPQGDDGGCRWVAVRHDEDHIHLVAVLARQDGRGVRRSWDFRRLREACSRAELRYGLEATAAADRSAAPRATRGEVEKAARLGRPVPREELRRVVRAAAVATRRPEAFLAWLRRTGVLVRERRQDGELVGYAVGLAEHRTGKGLPVWYGGRKLAGDLTLTKLTERWKQGGAAPPTPIGVARAAVLEEASRAAQRAAARLRAGRAGGDGVAHAAGELLTAAAWVSEARAGGPVTRAADCYDRAARAPWTPVPPADATGRQLRLVAGRVIALGRLEGEIERQGAARLVAALGALALAVGEDQLGQERAAQAAAARLAGQLLQSI
jgi:hypothetical protein